MKNEHSPCGELHPVVWDFSEARRSGVAKMMNCYGQREMGYGFANRMDGSGHWTVDSGYGSRMDCSVHWTVDSGANRMDCSVH